jgi:hypothetical protein
MRGGSVAFAVGAALLLSACASDTAFTIAGRPPNPKAFEEDASSCSGVGRSIGVFFVGALSGAAAGAALGVQAGSGRPEAAAIGAAGGAALGLLIGGGKGVADSISGDNYDLCMVRKGYRIAPKAEETAVIARQAPPRLITAPEQLSADPAR